MRNSQSRLWCRLGWLPFSVAGFCPPVLSVPICSDLLALESISLGDALAGAKFISGIREETAVFCAHGIGVGGYTETCIACSQVAGKVVFRFQSRKDGIFGEHMSLVSRSVETTFLDVRKTEPFLNQTQAAFRRVVHLIAKDLDSQTQNSKFHLRAQPPKHVGVLLPASTGF